MIIRLFPLRCGGGGLREYLPSIDGWMMTVTVTIYKAEAEATESKKNRRRRDASRRQAFPVCFRPGQFGAHVKGHAPGKRMKKDGMDDYTTRRIRLGPTLLLSLSLSLLLLLLLASSGLLTATDLSMFERVPAVMVHTCHLTYLSITLPPLEDTYRIYPPSLTYMMYPSDSQWRRPAEMHLPLP